MTTLANNKNIAIIGAGACGLCAAKYLTIAGFQVTIFEIGTQIGGLWCFMNDNGRSSAYRTLHINTSRGVTRFHDLDFDDDVQSFPDHEDMHKYLVKYAEHFNLIRLKINFFYNTKSSTSTIFHKYQHAKVLKGFHILEPFSISFFEGKLLILKNNLYPF